jgi:uncharacterized RDD family membrane protein YckC
LGARLLSFIIDLVVYAIIGLLCFVVGAALLLLSSDYGRVNPSSSAYDLFQVVLFLSAPIFDLVLLAGWLRSGRSAGKFITNTQIVGRDGGRPGPLRALVRLLSHPVMAPTYALVAFLAFLHALGRPLAFVSGLLAAATAIGGLLSLVLVLSDKRHRALHDILAGTEVQRST